MAISNQLKNQHLFWRAAFGPAAENLGQLQKGDPKSWYEALAKASSKKPVYINVAANLMDGLGKGVNDIVTMQKKDLSPDEKKALRQRSREALKSLNLTWLAEMVNTEAQLREKMAFFWHGHFACREINVFFQQLLLDAIRRNALGKFGDLLREVSKSAAMLAFLNNQQNRKMHPNENFAREVMELFTLGRGNYTEKDIQEAARAFTGWGFNLRGEFQFRPNQHDGGSKTFLGKTGNFNGDDILNILLDQPQTARFLTLKIYKFFVNESIADGDKLDWLATRFFDSEYDIGALMKDIFTSDWFFDARNIGNKIKSPVELLAGIRRALPMEIDNEESLLLLQRVLGQILFYPPNVAGWPGGKNWIDSSSLMVRLRIPQLLSDGEELAIRAKTDDDQAMGMSDMEMTPARAVGQGRKKMGARIIQANVNWKDHLAHFNKIPREQLLTELQAAMLQMTPGAVKPEIINRFSDESSKDAYIRTATLRLMGTPEYQLC